MSLYISSRQAVRPDAEQISLPVLLSVPCLTEQHRAFPPEFRFSNLLQDAYELSNTGSEEKPCFLLPSGSVTLIFQFSNRVSGGFICGPLTSIRQLPVAAGTKAFCIRLRPGSGNWLLGDRVSFLTDKSVALARYLPGVDRLLFQLRRSESFHERIILFCHLLNAQGAGSYRPMALVRRCVERIDARCGVIRVAELAQTAGCSERYLNRCFQSYVGISTKLYAEMVQLHGSLYHILTTRPRSLLDTAVAYGYFDQTHMNRFYRKFLDCTAGDMRCAAGRTLAANCVPSIL